MTASEKKIWEVQQGELVAAFLNQSDGSDYRAEAATAEPADVVLTSKSKNEKFPPLSAQIVSIPLDFRSRDDKGTVRNVSTALTKALIAQGFNSTLVGLVLSGKAEMHGIEAELLKMLADIICKEGAKTNL